MSYPFPGNYWPLSTELSAGGRWKGHVPVQTIFCVFITIMTTGQVVLGKMGERSEFPGAFLIQTMA